MEAFQVIDALLDVLDATGAVVGVMALWYTWVVPPRIAPEPAAVDLDYFLQAVATTVPTPSGQPQREAGGSPEPPEWVAGTTPDRA